MTDLATLSTDINRIAGAAAAGVVRIRARRGPPASGFVWRPGFIVTAEEAVEVDDQISVMLADGTKVAATLAGRDPSTDVALLRCDAATTPLSATAGLPATVARLGQLAIAVGLGRHGTLACLAMVNSVSGPWQSQQGGRIDQYIGLDMRFSPALEGAPLLGADGSLLGMVAAGPRHSHLAIPAATVERVAGLLQSKGRVARGYLGLGLQPVHIAPAAGSTDKRRAVMVVSVDAAGPGHAAGILQGDIVTAWNGEPVGSVHGIFRRLGPETVATTVDLTLQRAGQPATVRLTIGERVPT